MSRRELVSLDVLGSDEDLRAAARDDRPVVEDLEGRDASRAVVVRVDRQGQVTDVLISAWWRDDLTPSGLPDAVLTAYRQAISQATTQIAPHPSDRTSPIDVPVSDDDGDDYGWLVSVRRRLDQTEESLARSGERLTRTRDTERMITGPAGLVRLTVAGGVVSEVLIDARVALRESPNRIAADALAALEEVTWTRPRS